MALNISLMLAVGFELELSRVFSLAKRWGLVLYALALNFIAVPAFGFAATQALPLSSAVATGLMLVAISPGGGTGTLLTRVARADLELSVVMLFPLTALSVFITPFLAGLAIADPAATPGTEIPPEIPTAAMVKTLLIFQLLPLCLGIGTRRLSEVWAGRGKKIMSPLANGILAVLVVGLLITKGGALKTFSPAALLALLILSLAATAIGLFNGLDRRQRVALSLTTGVRSVSLALLIASAFFPDPKTILTVLTFALFMYGVGVPLAFYKRPALDS
jgi:BASS family bile acid:Na+ symporter